MKEAHKEVDSIVEDHKQEQKRVIGELLKGGWNLFTSGAGKIKELLSGVSYTNRFFDIGIKCYCI